MSETITASLTVSGGDTITAEINTLARGPAGPTGEVGASSFAELTDKASADLPTINTPLSSALSGKAATSHTHTASQISDASATGQAIITSATPAAARTALGFDAAVPKIPILFSISSDFTTTSTSFVDITSFSFPVAANKRYAVAYFISTNKNDASGLQCRITGPASPTRVAIRSFISSSSVFGSNADFFTAFSTASSTGNTFSGDGWFASSGAIIENGANAGTVQFQLRAVTGGTAKVLAGSWIQITEL